MWSKIMARDVQNFQSIKEKCVKKVDSRPELFLGCSQLRVWTPAGAKMDININKAVN